MKIEYTKEVEKLEKKVGNVLYKIRLLTVSWRPAYKHKQLLKESKNLLESVNNMNEEILNQAKK